MLRMLSRLSLVAASMVLMLFSTAVPAKAQEKTITYVHGPWSQSLFVTHVGRLMLERLGYRVEMKLLDTALVYQALASGKADLFSSSYLPGQQAYFNRNPGKLDIISMSYGPTPGGLMVPAYVPVNSIEDLKKPEVKKMFGGKIIGIDAGAGVMRQTEAAIKKYDLDMELVPSSAVAMLATFKAAYDKKEPILIVHNCPHYVCALYSVKFLEDPKQAYGAARDMHVARIGFRNDFPDAAKAIARITVFSDQLSEALVWMENEKIDAETAAKRFIERNPDLVWYWIGDLDKKAQIPESLKAMN